MRMLPMAWPVLAVLAAGRAGLGNGTQAVGRAAAPPSAHAASPAVPRDCKGAARPDFETALTALRNDDVAAAIQDPEILAYLEAKAAAAAGAKHAAARATHPNPPPRPAAESAGHRGR